MRKVTINGREYNIGYNMNTAIAYERMTGENAFNNLEAIANSTEKQMALGYAMLLSNNDPIHIPDMQELCQQMSDYKEAKAFLDAVGWELAEFFKVQPGDAAPKEPKDEAPKND